MKIAEISVDSVGDGMVASYANGTEVVWLDGNPVERSVVGGKGASLSRLAALGAEVPPSFALTTSAYTAAARHIGIPNRATDVTACELPGIRRAIESATIPNSLREQIAAGYERLAIGGGESLAVAVRSSATAEDSADHSFAGLHETVLDVEGMTLLEEAVKRCWASLWTERAVAYRRQVELANDDSSIAVVVQRMVRSDVSFVVFTRDPIQRSSDYVIINATWGLGEALVSGLVTPDHIVVDRSNMAKEYVIGEKAMMIVPGQNGGGTRELPVPRMLRAMKSLNEAQVNEIAVTSRLLATQLGYEADLEGGIANGKVYFFQARPITTLG